MSVQVVSHPSHGNLKNMETPQDSFRRKNHFMNGKTQNMATSAASDKNTDTDTLQKC